MAMISHLGAMISVINGALIARRFKGRTGAVGVASLGEGATSTGAFHEGINQAAVEKLPVVIVIANNQYAYSTPNSRQFACRDLLDKADGYGVQGWRADGTELADCLEVVGKAIDGARGGHGPQMVVAPLLRLVGHGEHDDGNYIDPALRQSPLGRDCRQVAEEYLIQRGWASAAALEQWAAEAAQQVDEAVATTLREAPPNPDEEEWCALATRSLAEGFSGE